MNKSKKHILCIFLFSWVSFIFAQINPASVGTADNLLSGLRGNGMLFTPNKGQMVDMEGKLRPEILYKGGGGGVDIYLRKTGMSYVTSNMGEVMSEINKEVELKKFDPDFSQQQAEELKHQLEAKALIKLQRTDVDFEGGNPDAQTLNEEEVEGYTNYYYAHCPNGITNVKSYNRVVQKNIYEGIDVIYYGGKQNGLKYDIVVNPGADPKQIKLNYIGAKVKLNGSKLIVQSELGETVETLPKVYQNINGKIVDVGCEYKLVNSEKRLGNREKTPPPNGYSLFSIGSIVSFELTTYNHELPLIIDPWASYYGGNGNEYGLSVAVDAQGNVVFTGSTGDINFPVSAGALQTIYGGSQEAFVIKMNPNGTRIFATYYGGSNDEAGNGITTDASGNILVAGSTASVDFPVGASAGNVIHQGAYGGQGAALNGLNGDAFLLKLNASGARIFATYYGGSLSDQATDIVSDGTNIYLYGLTSSTNAIATAGAFQNTYQGATSTMFMGDVFLTKFTPNGAQIWGTYIGGSDNESVGGIALASTGDIFIGGTTKSANFPTSGGYQLLKPGTVNIYGFLFKFNSAGSRVWSTYTGITVSDITLDANNNVIAESGGLVSGPLITGVEDVGAPPAPVPGGLRILKVSSTGTVLWGTNIGGNTRQEPAGIITDTNNNIYVCGEWEDDEPGNSPLSTCAIQPVFGGVEEQFIVKYSPSGQQKCFTSMGGPAEEEASGADLGFYTSTSIAVYGKFLYITGAVMGSGYPGTAGGFQSNFAGGITDAFINQLCINICEAKVLDLNYTANVNSVCPNIPVTFTPTVANACDTTGYRFQWTFTGGTPSGSTAVNPIVTFAGTGTHDVKLVLTTACKKDSVTNYITVNNCNCTMSAAATVTLNVSCNGAGNGSAGVTIGNGSGGTYTYSWSNGIAGTTIATTIPITGLSANTYTVTVIDGSCASVSTVTITQPLYINSITHTNITCGSGNNGSATVTISNSTAGPYTYNWSNGTSSTTNSLNNTITNLTSGTYTVTVSQGSCISTSTVTLTQPIAMAVGFTSNWSCQTNSGTTTAYPANGNPPYVFLWNLAGQTTSTITGLNAGTYSVTVTDASNCVITGSVAVNAPPLIVLNPFSTNISCSGSGFVQVTPTAGAGPFTYIWNDGSTDTKIDGGLVAGGYTVTVTDVYGCTKTQSFNISGTNPVSGNFTYTSPVCIGTTVNFKNTGTAPGPGVTHTWYQASVFFPVATTPDYSFAYLTAGTFPISHQVQSGGCTSLVRRTITVVNCAGPAITATSSSVCSGSCATVTSNSSGGTNPYTFSWSTGATTQNINPCPVSTTTYTVKVTDAGGVTATSTAVVTVNPAVTVAATSTNIACNGTSTGSVTATPGGGTPGFTYTWSNGGATSQITNLTSQIYTVTVTDSKGCTAVSTTTIVSPPALVGQYTKGTANCPTCGCKEWVMVTGINGTPPYSYQWPDGYDKRYKNALCPGIYNVIVTDNNGCKTTVKVNAP